MMENIILAFNKSSRNNIQAKVKFSSVNNIAEMNIFDVRISIGCDLDFKNSTSFIELYAFESKLKFSIFNFNS